MPEKLSDPRPVRGVLRWMARLPILLFRIRLGWILGSRFLLLRHTGRKSGLPRQTVLEVLDYDRRDNVYYVASGWGERSDWYLNLQADPKATIEVGRQRLRVLAGRLSPEAAGEAMVVYGRKHPAALRTLARVMGYRLADTEEDVRALGRLVPIIALRPRNPSA